MCVCVCVCVRERESEYGVLYMIDGLNSQNTVAARISPSSTVKKVKLIFLRKKNELTYSASFLYTQCNYLKNCYLIRLATNSKSHDLERLATNKLCFQL